MQSVAENFARLIHKPYFHFAPKSGNIFGTAIFSDLEIVSIDTVFQLLSHTNEAKVYGIAHLGDTLRIANVHLQSYNLLGKGSGKLLTQCTKAITARLDQCRQLLRQPALDLMVGDFNAAPGSEVYKMLEENHRDVLRDQGLGFYPTHRILPLKLDYAFATPRLRTENATLHTKTGSDHKAIILNIKH